MSATEGLGSVSTQFVLYQLQTPSLTPVLEQALAAARASGVKVEMGRMSSTLEGSIEQVLNALRAAFEVAAASGDAILVVTVSSACPILEAN